MLSRTDRIGLVVATMLMAAAAWCNAEIPIVLGTLGTAMENVRRTGADWGLRESRPALAALAAFFLAREVLQVIRKYLVHNTSTRVEKDVTVRLVSHLLQIEMNSLNGQRVGSLHGRIRRSVEGLVKLVKLCFLDFTPAVFTAVFALVVAIVQDASLGLLMTGVVPVATVIVAWQILSQKGIRLVLLRSKECVDGTVVEQLNGIEYVRAANTHAQEVCRVEQVGDAVRQREMQHHIAMSLFDAAKAINEGLFFLLVVAASIHFAAAGRISVGEVLSFALLYANVLTPLREVHRIIDETHESTLKVGDLLAMLSEPLDRSFTASNDELPALISGDLVVQARGLHLAYPGVNGAPKAGLCGVSLSIQCGETIGIAGPSGGGKSSLIRAVLRLAHPNSGELWIAGIPVQSVSRETIGKLVGYVGQTPFLFAGTVAENIAYGCGSVTDEAVQRAAHSAAIHDEILAMPGGYAAPVAERGQNLSGGQRQRIALARVFLRNPPILVLDEATSALDTLNERLVQQAIEAAKVNRTVIIVAHRLSTLRDTDRILVFAKGRIVETGTYDELIKHDGVFAQLACHVERSPRVGQ